jgi:hypothetical protein
MDVYKGPHEYRIEGTVFPIFIIQLPEPVQTLTFTGTGFLLNKGVFVTCWHCVRSQLPDNQAYAVAIESAEGEYGSVLLEHIQQDANGTDLATARLDLEPTLQFTLANASAHQGHEVWTYGYPLTGVRQHPELEEGGRSRGLQAQVLHRVGSPHRKARQSLARREVRLPSTGDA